MTGATHNSLTLAGLIVTDSKSAWIDANGTPAAFVFDAGFTAMRDAAGNWTSPVPPLIVGDLGREGFRLASADLAAALMSEARAKARAPAVLSERLTDAEVESLRRNKRESIAWAIKEFAKDSAR